MKTKAYFSSDFLITLRDEFCSHLVDINETDQPKSGDNGSNPNPPVTQPPKV